MFINTYENCLINLKKVNYIRIDYSYKKIIYVFDSKIVEETIPDKNTFDQKIKILDSLLLEDKHENDPMNGVI